VAAFWLLGAGLALAQDFPEGTFASDAEACAALATKTPVELGDEFDFQVLSKKGLVAFEQVCDFVSIVAHDASSWVATAFCNEAGYTYPDLFSIRKKGEEKLNVTRVTDLTQGSPVEDADVTDAPEADESASGEGARDGASEDEAAGEQSDRLSEEQAAESYSSFVKCQSVKP
jgi:hypothetical protein